MEPTGGGQDQGGGNVNGAQGDTTISALSKVPAWLWPVIVGVVVTIGLVVITVLKGWK